MRLLLGMSSLRPDGVLGSWIFNQSIEKEFTVDNKKLSPNEKGKKNRNIYCSSKIDHMPAVPFYESIWSKKL